ncbi:MAG: hypothetical protein ACM3ST_09680 [Bdellovibrio bacteriovorus]
MILAPSLLCAYALSPTTSTSQTPLRAPAQAILRWDEAEQGPVRALLARFGLEVLDGAPESPIPGSYWGESEAGLVGSRIFVRPDTPLHSLLHEACHYVCMDAQRRAALDTDAGGDYAEEDAVCYLQILLADEIPGLGRERMLRDMDAWGYTFRLGSARAWFEADASDARDWLSRRGLIDEAGRPTWFVRLD